MLASLLLTVSSVFMLENATLTPVLQLEPVGDDSDVFLSSPMDVTIDAEGRFYITDFDAKTVFVWDKDGSFVGNIGKGGQGPGEFRFSSMGGPQAYLGIQGDNLLVYDGANKSVNLFSRDGKFQNSTILSLPQGRTEYVKVTPEGNFVVYQQKWGDDPKREVGVFSKDGERINDVVSVVDKTYSLRPAKNGQRFGGLMLNAFSARMSVHYNRATGEILAGEADKPSFDVYNLKGQKLKKVTFKMLQPEVTADDKAEFQESPWIKSGMASGFIKVKWPEKKAYYTHLLPVADKGYLVLRRSPHYANMEGIMVDRNGKTLSNFSLSCGENGNMYSVDGRIIAIALDEEGEFIISELKIGEIDS